MAKNYTELFYSLTASVESFTQEVKNKESTLMATSEWTVKDELCHIVFWHENYAANYEAMAKHEQPPLPEDMSTINMAGVIYLRKYSIKKLLERLQIAHRSLYKSIVIERVPQMTYSKGGRTYKTEEFLEMIAKHIANHTKQIRRV